MLIVNKHCSISTTSILSGHFGRSRSVRLIEVSLEPRSQSSFLPALRSERERGRIGEDPGHEVGFTVLLKALLCSMQWNPDSGLIREIFACKIRNPGKLCLWNPESRVLESGIQLKESRIPLTIGNKNPSSGIRIRNPRRGIQNRGLSWIPSHGVNCRLAKSHDFVVSLAISRPI